MLQLFMYVVLNNLGGPLAHPDFTASNETLDFLLDNCKASFLIHLTCMATNASTFHA